MSILELFCDVDDFCQTWACYGLPLQLGQPKRYPKPSLALSEITICHTEEGCMLDVSCELVIEPVSLPIETSRFQAGGCNRQKIILSALLMIDHPAPRLTLCPNQTSTKKYHSELAEVSYVVSA